MYSSHTVFRNAWVNISVNIQYSFVPMRTLLEIFYVTVNEKLKKLEERKKKQQQADHRRMTSWSRKKLTMKEVIRQNKVGDVAQLYGIPSHVKALDEAYPDTTRDEIQAVVDPVWQVGTADRVRERDEFSNKLAEIYAVTDMKKLNVTGREDQDTTEDRVLQDAERKRRLREFLDLKDRPDVRARQKHMAHTKPKPPNLAALAKGGHILLCCLTSGEVNNVRVFPIIRTLRLHSDKPLVILSRRVPMDWWRVVEASAVWYLEGSPLELFDLKRANFHMARSIIILQGGVAMNPPTYSICLL